MTNVTIDELEENDGIYHEKSAEVPFTGEVDGAFQRGSIKKGKKEGSWMSYHDNGQLNQKGNFKNGKEEGSWESYYDDGTIWKELTGIRKDDGNVIESLNGTFKNGTKVSD